MNATTKFHDVRKTTFPSILRRSLVIDLKDRWSSLHQTPALESVFGLTSRLLLMPLIRQHNEAEYRPRIELSVQGGGD